MATEVSSLVRVLTGFKDDHHRTVGKESGNEKFTPLITRDLLGGGAAAVSSKFSESPELDLDLQVPSGWEKRLDLKSGKMYIQRCNIQDFKVKTNPTLPKLQDLNFPPSPNHSKSPLLNLLEGTSLDLKLVSSPSSPSSSSSPRSNYQSVCTLDKVKSALERAEKDPIRKRSSLWKSTLSKSPSPSPSYSSSSSSIKEHQDDESSLKCLSSPTAAGCPGCLSYVLVMKNNPTCPRCNSIVPLPAMKKARIDLNISI